MERTLEQRREDARGDFRAHFKQLLEDKLTPEQLAEVKQMPGIGIPAIPCKGMSNLDKIYHPNPMNIQATREIPAERFDIAAE